MERNHIIGFILIFATLLTWTIFTAPSEEELAERKRIQDSIAQVEQIDQTATLDTTSVVQENRTPDTLSSAAAQYGFGPFAQAATGENQKVVLENDQIKIEFDTKGGKISKVDLKKFNTLKKDAERNDVKGPLYLLNNKKDEFNYKMPVRGVPSGFINTADLYFTPTISGNKLSLRAPASGGYVEQIYTLEENYALDYDLRFVGLQNVINTQDAPIELDWTVYLNKLEKSEQFEQRYSTIYFKESKENNPDNCSCMGDDEEDSGDNTVDWVSNTNQFFSSILMAKDKSFKKGDFQVVMSDIEKDDYLKVNKSTLGIPFNNTSDETFNMMMYIGPNEYNDLKKYDKGLTQIIPFGNSIFGSINRHVIRPFFNFLSSFIGSKGIVILVMIFLVKMLLYPLMYKMLKSQALMGALKPELAHLNEKYKDNAQQKQMETMKVYREYGVSPFGGCMPMVIQIPIWYSLFRFFPASITFRQEQFLWANDLSSYDDFFHLPFNIPFVGDHLSLFTILYSLSMLAYTYYNTRHMDMSANPAMKYMQYFMPVMFFGFFNNYAAGLTCYMFFSNMINIAQTVITKKFVFSDEKLREELNAKKAKPKKKNTFQQRLEAAMKEQQAKQAAEAKKKKK